MPNATQIITALRCREDTGRKCDKDCPYHYMHPADARIPLGPDMYVGGKGYWEGCNVAQLDEDAANMIEKLTTAWVSSGRG